MTASLKLYEATDAIDVVRDWIYEHDEEIRAMEGALPDELAELLAQAEGDFKAKAERVALFVRELLANAAAVKIEEERLGARRKHYEKAAEQLKTYLLFQMQAADIPKIEGKLATVRIQKSPPSLKVNTEVWTQQQLRALHAKTPEIVAHMPESFVMNARAILDLAKFPDEKGKGFHYVAPLPGMTIEQGSHVRIV